MRVAVDVTPLLDPRTGIGTYTAEVSARLAAAPGVEVVGYSASWRGRDRIAALAPPGVRVATRPMAAQPLRRLWQRLDAPPIEWWTGPVDVVLGTNFVVPPTRRAAQVAVVYDLTPWRFPELCTADTLQYPGLVARAVGRGAHLLTISRWVADELVALLGVPAERVHWAHLAPATGGAGNHGDAGRGRALAGADRYVLALGTEEPRKAFPSLVRAFAHLAADDPALGLVIAGQPGWGSAELDQAVGAVRAAPGGAGVAGRIRRLGHVDDGARADLLAGAAVFAYPSRYEGFGLPPVEAMAAGVPVVASAAGPLPEVLGDAAVLVPPGDDAALAAALAGVLTADDDERARLVAAGRDRARRYSWDDTAAAVLDVLRAAVSAR